MKRVTLLLALLLSGLVFAQIPLKPFNPINPPTLPTELKETDLIGPFGTVYRFYWDGWEGKLVLYRGGTGHLEVDGRKYNARFVFPCNPQDIVAGTVGAGPGYTGKNTNMGHRIVIFIDFPNTPNNRADDQRFDGYVFTQTIKTPGKIAAAGITWWDGIPFGFYMTYWYEIIG